MFDFENLPSDIQELVMSQVDDADADKHIHNLLNVLEIEINNMERFVSYLSHHKNEFITYFDLQDKYCRCKTYDTQYFEQKIDLENIIQWYHKNDYDMLALEHPECYELLYREGPCSTDCSELEDWQDRDDDEMTHRRIMDPELERLYAILRADGFWDDWDF